jgi:hypothetical protein
VKGDGINPIERSRKSGIERLSKLGDAGLMRRAVIIFDDQLLIK